MSTPPLNPQRLFLNGTQFRCSAHPNPTHSTSDLLHNMATFQQIIAEGNSICDLIEAGEHSVAVSSLTCTLTVLKEIMAHADHEEGIIKTSLDQCMKNKSVPAPCTGYIDEETTAYPQFVFQRPIRMPSNIGCSYNEIIFASCIVIFLAIAYHLQGDGESLVRALKLYELSFNLQREQQFDHNVLFILATVNNLGLIHKQLHDEHSSRMCFEHVLSTLMYLTDCGEANDSNLDGFFRNIFGIVSNGCAAPAA